MIDNSMPVYFAFLGALNELCEVLSWLDRMRHIDELVRQIHTVK